MHKVLSIAALVAIFVCASYAAKSEDLITSLPGFNVQSLDFEMYSGYINITDHSRSLFYWFVQSANDPKNDPVVLWLNGGPGCSSLDGLFSEHGPLHFDLDGNLYANPYSWNKVANIIYLESPAGVGFSFSADGSLVLTDSVTAEDSYSWLQNFFKYWPELLANEFYVAGESYAGHYVPQLSYQIMQGNSITSNTFLNFQGFMVGNGVTDDWYDGQSYLPFMYTHAFVSDELYYNAYEACGGNFATNNMTACNNALNAALAGTSQINMYNIYDACVTTSDFKPHPLKHLFGDVSSAPQIPCINSTVETNYLNEPSVQEAIHAKVGINWNVCNFELNENYVRDETVLPLYPQLLSKYRAIVYSGDVDSAVNYQGTQGWVNSLSLPVVAPWTPWYTPDGQNAGFVKVYEPLTWLTVRGSGHMVPQYRPAQAYYFFSKWITHQNITSF